MSGFTKGPWTFDGPPDNHIVWASEQGRICFMAHSAGVDPEGDTANARLVASAPDLLEALHGLNGILGTAESNASGTPEWEHVSAKVNAARKAIAKALGEQS